MNETGSLSIREFLEDIRLTIVSPARRFHVIQERGALWGSLLLLIAPAYVGFHWWGAIYFDKDPFPGYSLLAPLVPAVALSLLKPCAVLPLRVASGHRAVDRACVVTAEVARSHSADR